MSGNLLSYLNSQEAARNGTLKTPSRSGRAPSRAPKPSGGGKFYQPKKVAPVRSAPPHKSGGGGGFLGRSLHYMGSSLGAAGHDIAHASDQAAHDIAAMPAGFAVAGSAIAHDYSRLDSKTPFGDPKSKNRGRGHWETPLVGKAIAHSTAESIKHPLRDPFQSVLNVAAVASMGAGSVARAGAAGDAIAEAGDASLAAKAVSASKALARKPVMKDRFLKVPKNLEGKDGKIIKEEKIQLMHSHQPLPRAFQALHDRIVQRSLNKVNGEHPSLIYKYGKARIGKATTEVARRADRVRMTLPFELDKIKKFDKPLSREEGHLALFLRSANVTPAEVADFWASLIDHPETEHPALMQKMSELAHDLHLKGALRVKNGEVSVNGRMFPKLHAADTLVKEAQKTREGIIGAHDLLSPEAMSERLNLVAKTVGVEREGKGYTYLGSSRKNISPYPRAGSVPVTAAKVKNFITRSKIATGKGVRQGFIPDNTTRGVAASLRDSLTYLRKTEHRQMVAKFGSDYRNTKDDVLVGDPKAKKIGKIPSSTRQVLGQEHSTMNTLSTEHEVGLANAMQAKLHDMLPHTSEDHPYNEKFQNDQQVGVKAPTGYKWVHKNELGDLAKSVQPRRGFVKKIDTINSAVTAATVYFKISHVPQRLATDATTSAMNGALFSRHSWRMYYKLRNEMTPKQLNEIAQSTGTHGYSALPHEGEGVTAKLATSGANMYSHHIDAHFRLLNIIHEAHRVGINDVQGLRNLIKFAKNPLMKSKYAAKYEHVLGRADRVSMMYDGLTAGERATVARAFWFYPWTKAATRYAGHVIAEHPKVSAIATNEGVLGREDQDKKLGDLPSFEYGLVPMSHNRTLTPGWLTPFNTAGNVAEYGARPEQIVGNLNPVYGAALTAIGGPNQYGETGQPHPLSQAADQAVSPTPEARILHDFLDQKSIEKKTRMFPHSAWDTVLRSAILGPGLTPKKTNKKALHFAHKKEHGGFLDILVPKK